MDSWIKIGLYTLTAQIVKSLFYFAHEKLYRWIKRRNIKKKYGDFKVEDTNYASFKGTDWEIDWNSTNLEE